MSSIAGHTFPSTATSDGKCVCGKRFSDISGVTREDIGQWHWAHSGTLLEREYDEIRAEVERIYGTVTEAATS